MLLLGFFACTGLILAVIGLYGVISFFVAQRTQEIGGSDRDWRVPGRHSAACADECAADELCRGVLLGLVLALTLSRVLSSLLFEVAPHDPVAFTAVTCLLVSVALLASLIPGGAATRVNPLDALRCD